MGLFSAISIQGIFFILALVLQRYITADDMCHIRHIVSFFGHYEYKNTVSSTKPSKVRM